MLVCPSHMSSTLLEAQLFSNTYSLTDSVTNSSVGHISISTFFASFDREAIFDG